MKGRYKMVDECIFEVLVEVGDL